MNKNPRISDLFRNTWLSLTNRLRLWHRRLVKGQAIDYVVLKVGGNYPERTHQTRRRFPLSLLPWPAPPPSVESFVEALEHLAADPHLRGVVLIISELSAGWATVSSLRQAIDRFRKSGKRAVAYLHEIHTRSYYLAAACDEILAPESATFGAAGLWSETVFLKDTLALVGLQADIEAIAEYKVTPDTFRRSEMTEPHREMLDAILDSVYQAIVRAMAEGRALSPERIGELLDSTPLSAEQAHETQLFDAVCYEDELPGHLGQDGSPAGLVTWERAQRRLLRPRRWHNRRAVGVISLEGLIVPGTSRRSPVPLPLPLPLPSRQAGAETVVQQLRAAAQDKHLAAVILHVDSPGGSAFASDLIWREVHLLQRHKPVVVYMGDRATSGGYYVAAPVRAIVAQPATLTGSIGIWGGKIVTRELYQKVQAGREVAARGKAAGLHADTAPFDEEERAKIRANLGQAYTRFKARVAQGRALNDEEVEAVARGRVWTGEQALARGLVDALGDLHAAAERACQLAGLDPERHTRLVNVQAPKRYQLARYPDPSADGAAWLAGWGALLREGVVALSPWEIRIE